ncbi:MAG TPA: hypothetical protein VJ937_11665, partial [Salinivirga sp.]|uniref:hypothetical protein n=1 Tax=Salinivirga sp. TaxID=1970192 RepID=UPI002B47967A
TTGRCPVLLADGPFGAFWLVDYVDVLWWFIVLKLIMLIYWARFVRCFYHRALPCAAADGPFGAFELVDYVDV